MTRKQNGTLMLAYFLPEHQTQGQRQLDLVAGAFSWYSQAVGPYPFDTYTIVEMGVPLDRTDNYAQELGDGVRPYVAPAMNALRPLLDTLPVPAPSDEITDERIANPD